MRHNRSLVEEDFGREKEAIFSGADRGSAEAGGSRGAGQRAGATGGDLGADLLPLEAAVREAGDRPSPPAEAIAGRKRATETVGGRSDLGQDDVAGCAGKKILKPPRRRQGVGYLRGGYHISERRACVVMRLNRGTFRYESHKDPRTELRMRMREMAAVRLRYGCRKILVLLQREGWAVGKSLVRRIYLEQGLSCAGGAEETASSGRAQRRIKPSTPNQVWSLDFVADQLADGRRFRALTVVDVYTRESLAIEPGQRLRGEDVVQVLQRIQEKRGGPKRLFCDNGSEFASQVLDLWAYQNGVKIDLSRPGKPTDNGHIESFNGTFRDECLNTHWFMTLAEAREIIEAWRREYNESRPHRALGERTPHEFAIQIAASGDLNGLKSPQDSL